jgi:DNA-binding IclR family transcriptional regulator
MRVLQAVREIGADGGPVGTREVCTATGLSLSVVWEHLDRLVKDGLVERNPRGYIGFRAAVEDVEALAR